MKPEFELFDRRGFFGAVTKTAAILGLIDSAKGQEDRQSVCL